MILSYFPYMFIMHMYEKDVSLKNNKDVSFLKINMLE